jgi:ribosome-binding factor A
MTGGDPRRAERVAEGVRAEVALFLRDGAKDPRLRGLVTITGVEVTRDLRHARVFVSVLGSDEERASTMLGLASVAHHLRGSIGRALRLRAAPEIDFRLDESIAHAARIEALLAQVRDEGAAAEGGREAGGSASGDAPAAADAVNVTGGDPDTVGGPPNR